MDRWEYLASRPYQVRLRVAEHFLNGYTTVVDVGPYHHKLVLSDTETYVCIDPLGTVDGWRGTVSEWWDKHGFESGFALCCLGLALEGDRAEWDALVEMSQKAEMVVVEWAADFQQPYGNPMMLTAGRRTVFHASFTLPDTQTPGYPVYPRRHMVVAE